MTTHTRTARAPWSALLKRDDRRQGYRIDPSFQNRFRARMLAFSMGILVMAALLARCVLQVVAHPESVPLSPWVPGALFGLSLGIGAMIYYLSDRLSHRYCGPVYRLVATLQAIERGERPAPIRLREKDEFQNLAEALNDALRSLGVLEEPGPPAAPPPQRPPHQPPHQ